MKVEYIITPQKQKYSQNSRLQRGNCLQKKQNTFFGWESDGDWFLDSYKVIVIDYLQKGKIITGAYYESLPDMLKVEIA